MAQLIIGLTGGIGSGKSAASERFASHGITIVDADVVAREVVVPGSAGLAAIAAHHGTSILLSDGNLNRAALREIIFNDPAQKTWLENLLHPLINQSIRTQLAAATSVYAILASPLLLETQQYQLVARVLVVDATESAQLLRASGRDGVDEGQIRRIMASQLSRSERCARAQDIIQNHTDLADLYAQVDRLHERYLALAAQA